MDDKCRKCRHRKTIAFGEQMKNLTYDNQDYCKLIDYNNRLKHERIPALISLWSSKDETGRKFSHRDCPLKSPKILN